MFLVILATQAIAAPLSRVDEPMRRHQDVLGYRFEVTIPDTGTGFDGRATIRYRALEPGQGLVLDLHRALAVRRVVAGGETVPFAHRGDTLVIERWGGFGDTLEVTVEYAGRPDDGLLIGPTARGRRAAFADNWPSRARFWLPVNDHPSDKATVSWVVAVPRGWRVIANGRLLDTLQTPDGQTRWRYEEPRPLPTYTYVIGAGDLAVTPVGGSVPQSLWTSSEDSAFASGGPFRRVGEILNVLAHALGPFPYEGLAHVQALTRFGGMENAGAIFYADLGYVERTMGESVVTHEIAHQWFGDAVTPRDWHHLWLSEGLASYLEPVFYQLVGERDAFRASMEAKRSAYLASSVVDRPILDFAEAEPLRLLNANNYPKAAWVLHMLRREVGDSAFFRGLRRYYAQYRDSTAVSADFASVMEAESGLGLGWFFEQWLVRPGYPDLLVTVTRYGRTRIAQVEIEQAQPAAWGVFRVPIRVDIANPATGLRASVTVRMRDRRASVILRVPEGADSIIVDPQGELLQRSRSRWK